MARAYVINLPRSKERRALMERQLAGSGLDYEFVDGIDGRALSADERAELVDETEVAKHPHWLTSGMVGATLSHRLVYQRIAAAGQGAALVLEDDAQLPADFATQLDALAAHVSPRELILLNFRSFGPATLSRTGAVSVGGRQLLVPTAPRQLVSALAYLVGQEAAARMEAIILPVRWAPDSWGEYVERGAVSLKVLLPQLVKQDINTRSAIHYGDELSLRDRIANSSAMPIRALRLANRHRVLHQMTRVKLLD